ncbi:MAG: GAF domain-containing protein, partial [Flavobacteriales bacterium]
LYAELIPQIDNLLRGEASWIANMANTSSVIYHALGFHWVGFYLVEHDELVLGPFHGPVACTRIQRGKGVCGHAWQVNQTTVVPDVDLFPGHIACSAASRSELVIPLMRNHQVVGVFDIDSSALNDFQEDDVHFFERVAAILMECDS